VFIISSVEGDGPEPENPRSLIGSETGPMGNPSPPTKELFLLLLKMVLFSRFQSNFRMRRNKDRREGRKAKRPKAKESTMKRE
jgi:hypothetical protein